MEENNVPGSIQINVTESGEEICQAPIDGSTTEDEITSESKDKDEITDGPTEVECLSERESDLNNTTSIRLHPGIIALNYIRDTKKRKKSLSKKVKTVQNGAFNKFSSRFCVICNKENLTNYTAIESRIGQRQKLAENLEQYCDIDITTGIMCAMCIHKLRVVDRNIKWLQSQHNKTTDDRTKQISELHVKRLCPIVELCNPSTQETPSKTDGYTLASPSRIPHITPSSEKKTPPALIDHDYIQSKDTKIRTDILYQEQLDRIHELLDSCNQKQSEETILQEIAIWNWALK